jgi:TPR repeat protein
MDSPAPELRAHGGLDRALHRRVGRQACHDGRKGACQTWVRITSVACVHGAGNACNQLGLAMEGALPVVRDAVEEGKAFGRACDAKVAGSCANLVALVKRDGESVFLPSCNQGDGESCYLLGSLYYAGGGVRRDLARSSALFRQACESGWARGCGGAGELYKAGNQPAQAIEYFERACRSGIAASCYAVGVLYRANHDEALAGKRLQQACDLSVRAATDNAAYFRAGAGQTDAPLPFCAQ